MSKRPSILLVIMLVVIMAVSALAAACGGDEETTTTAGGTETTAGGTETTGAATGEPIKFGFTEGFTGFMAYDTELAEKGILTALDMLGNQWEGRPLEYLKEDNGSDPVVAVDKARKLVESDNINCMIGPIFSPSAKAVADYPGQVVRHPADLHRGTADREPGDRQRVGLHPHRLLRFPRLLLRQVPG